MIDFFFLDQYHIVCVFVFLCTFHFLECESIEGKGMTCIFGIFFFLGLLRYN